jgi:hypothetical protein
MGVTEGIVGHHALHAYAERGHPRHGVLKKAHRAERRFVGQELGVGDARGVVDRNVQALPPDPPCAPRAIPMDPVPDVADVADACELLRIDVQRLPGCSRS